MAVELGPGFGAKAVEGLSYVAGDPRCRTVPSGGGFASCHEAGAGSALFTSSGE